MVGFQKESPVPFRSVFRCYCCMLVSGRVLWNQFFTAFNMGTVFPKKNQRVYTHQFGPDLKPHRTTVQPTCEPSEPRLQSMSVDLEYRILFQAYTPSRHAASWIAKSHARVAFGSLEGGRWDGVWIIFTHLVRLRKLLIRWSRTTDPLQQ